MRKFLSLSVLIMISGFWAAAGASAATMDVVLNLKPRVSMIDLANSVLNPRSPRYHRFYTPREIMELASPTDAELNALAQQLRTIGLSIVSASPVHLMVTVRGDSANLQRLFNTRLQYGFNRAYFRNLSPVIVPPGLPAVASVTGFDNSRPRRPKWSVPRGATLSSTPRGILPDEIKSLYAFDPIYQAGITGKGQDIAIATYGGFYIQDVAEYFAKVGISPAPSVDAVAFNGSATLDPMSAIETQVDAEFSGMIAPGASIHVFTSAHNDDAGEVQLFTAILDDGRAKVVNYSWGTCDAQVSAQHKQDMDNIFARAIAQGVNIMVASGDSGSAGCDQSGDTVADFPASSPMVIAVGGTTLSKGPNGEPAETAWNGSGGGISQAYPAPAWQAALHLNGRGEPDVAFNADPKSGEPAFVHDPDTGATGFITIGGTSIAAPQWTGLLALLGQARGAARPVGALGPIIYATPGADLSAVFHDVTRGSNGAYSAGPGWDAVTGWGSPDAANLLKYLSGI